MGYTHYWKGTKEFNDDQWKQIENDFKKLHGAAPMKIVQINKKHIIQFNGVGAESHEDFVLAQAVRPFEFCKTARKPYDIMVCAMLIVAHRWGPTVLDVSSDGDPEDWQPALNFVHEVLGADYQLPLKEEA